METYRMWDSALNIPRVATRTTRSIRSLLRGGTCRIRHVGRSCCLRWLVPALPIPGIGVTTALGTIHAVCTSEQRPLMETRVSGGCKFDTCGGRKSDGRQHGLAAG